MTNERLDWAPIALFIYNRPDHTRRMITSLQACHGFAESTIYVFADGPKRDQDIPAVQTARAEARRLLGDGAVYLERDANLGVDTSIIEGVTELCNRHGAAVVIEDDLILAPYFLMFLNMGLRRYKDQPRVMQVCGYMFDIPHFRERSEALFLRMTSSWGWAIWKRAWDQFDPEATGWRDRLRGDQDRRRFDLDGHFNYRRMLSLQMSKRVPAWDIRWYYSVFSRDGLALCPPRTLVLHTGFDGTGTHFQFSLPVHQAALETNASFALPTRIEESPDKKLVFEAAARFRPSTSLRKAIALVIFIVDRAGLRSLVPRWSRK